MGATMHLNQTAGCGAFAVTGLLLGQGLTARLPAAEAASSAATESSLIVTASRRARRRCSRRCPGGAGHFVPDLSAERSGGPHSTLSLPAPPRRPRRGSRHAKSTPSAASASETFGDTVGFYLDEFGFSIPGEPFAPDVYDVQRIEVLRGQPGLYGQGSIGGTIKILTNDPDFTSYYGSVRGTFRVNRHRLAELRHGPDGQRAAGRACLVRAVFSASRLGGYVDYPFIR